MRRLAGHRRALGVAMDNTVDLPGYKWYRDPRDGSRPAVFVAFLDLVPAAGAVNGVCVPVPAGGWPGLEARERNYDRVDVTAAIADPPGRVWAYVGSEAGRARLRRGAELGRAVVTRGYMQAVETGFAALGPAERAAFAASTDWSGACVADLERVDP